MRPRRIRLSPATSASSPSAVSFTAPLVGALLAALIASVAFVVPASATGDSDLDSMPLTPVTAPVTAPATTAERAAFENATATMTDEPVLMPAAAPIITGTLVYTRIQDGVEVPVTTGDGTVRFWRQDAIDGLWYWIEDVTTFTGTGGFTSNSLIAGTYRIEFISFAEGFPRREYWNNAPLWIAAVEFPANDDVAASLGTISLEPNNLVFERIAGNDRFETSVAISESVIPAGGTAPVVYIVNGFGFADALSAGPAAARSGGVILLTAPTSIPAVVATELDRLNPAEIVVVGGTGVVSLAVEAQLADFVADPSDVRRVAGADRYATSRAVVDDAFGFSGVPVLFVATGAGFADALAAGPAAARAGGAVLLVNGSGATTDIATRTLITALGLPEVIIAGGTGSVSAGVATSLATHLGGSQFVTRFGGTDRFETAAIINEAIFGVEGTDFVYVANGLDFPDALSGGPLAAAFDAPLYLSTAACLDEDVFFDMYFLLAKEGYALGGTGVLSDRVLFGDLC